MKFSKYVVLFFIGLFLALLSCSKPEPFDSAAVRKAIEEGGAKWAEAFNRGDATDVAALYTEDATLLPPNSEIIQGRQGIQDFWNGGIQMGLKDISLTIVNIGGSGDTAYEIGKYNLKIQPADQEGMTDSGKYLVVWKRQADGTWKLHVDIFNSSMPMPGQ
jgi:uncharacterized protein (TIGR02246 family)